MNKDKMGDTQCRGPILSRQHIILFSNQKGGVGKTTLTRECGFFLSGRGFKVLLVDCDGQGNLTKGTAGEGHAGLYEALEGERITFTPITGNLYILSGDSRLSALEKRLTGEVDAFTRLSSLFESYDFEAFDFILIDTPPSLGTLTINAFTASHKLVIPMSPSLYTMQGTNDLVSTISKVRGNLNPNLSILGVIINGYDSVPIITRQIKDEIEAGFGDKVFYSVLPKSIKVEEAIAKRCSVLSLKESKQSRKIQNSIVNIGNEFLTRLGLEGMNV